VTGVRIPARLPLPRLNNVFVMYETVMLVDIKEYVIDDHIKIVYICDGSECLVIGDLPALDWCFEINDELSISEVKVCYSEKSVVEIKENTVQVVIEGAEVLGKLRSIGFIAYGVRDSLEPKAVYRAVINYISSVCSRLSGRV